MRLFDNDHKQRTTGMTILVTEMEANMLLGYLEELLTAPCESGDHVHVNSEDYQQEITIAIYDDRNLRGFSDRMKQLIIEDK